MDSVFEAAFFSGNRQRLREELNLSKKELVVVPAHMKLQKSHDEAFAFVQDSNFYYLTGIHEPDGVLILTADADVLISSAIDAHHQLWEGQADIKRLINISGIQDVLTGTQGALKLKSLVSSATKVYMPSPYDTRFLHRYYRMVPNPARQNLRRKLKNLNPNLVIEDSRLALAKLRMIKQPAELAAISRAIKITVGSIDTVSKQLAQLKTENELQALLEYEFLRHGADGTAFDSIVASGSNTTQIHYMRNDQVTLDGSLVLLDVGARVSGYASDISRVISQTPFNKRKKQIYDAVKELQDYALTLLKPGIALPDYEDLVDQKSLELTEDLRVAKHKTVRKELRVIPHLISHHIGLDAHDSADYKAPLQAGMVLAVEPGIYLPEEGIGIRLEDDVMVTSRGINILSKPKLS